MPREFSIRSAFRATDGLQLPAPPVNRWTPGRKAAVLIAVTINRLTAEEACRRYDLGEAELAAWFAAFKAHGEPGLRTTRLTQLRGRRRGFANPRGRPRSSVPS